MTPLEMARAVSRREPAGLEALTARLSGEDRGAIDAWLVLERGGLLPQAATGLAASGLIDRLVPRHQKTLRSAVEASTVGNALLRRLAVDVSRRLAEQDIPVLWAKGVWLAHFVHDQPAHRPMADVDLFVPPGWRGRAVEILRAAGYQPDPTVEATGLEVFADALRPPSDWPGHQPGHSVDLHDAVQFSAVRSWPVEGLWDHATPVTTKGVVVHLPSPEDGLRFAALHAMKHGLDLRHLVVAVSDTVAILRRHATTLDVARACRRLGNPFEATAIYVLLTAAGPGLGPAAQQILEQAGLVARRHGTLRLADRLQRAADHPAFVGVQDFSLFSVGERGARPAALSHLVRGAGRWRRRVTTTERGDAYRARPAWRRLRAVNWRWAWTTYLAGRLSGRLRASAP